MNTTYFLYARKSQERDDRQVASIKDQISDMKTLANRLGLTIVEVFEEAKSAKRKGRPVFKKMLDRIKKGEANGIICWKLNRLARNAYDAGDVTDLLQEEIITHIQTYEKGFYPHDNVMLMMIEFGIATQYSKDLSQAVKRGYRCKAARRWYPLAILPVGYIHNPRRIYGEDDILPDPKRFPILKQLWEMLATGAYSISELREKAKTLGLINKKGKSYSYSSFHRIFSRPFYYGMFYWKDENGEMQEILGKHKAMISKTLFIQVQITLGKNNRDTRSKSLSFPYKGLLTCGECTGHITAERKQQVICTACKQKFSCIRKNTCPNCALSIADMDSPSRIDITYYRCTKNKYPNCSQKPIRESIIEEGIIAELKKIEIKKDFYDYAMEQLNGELQPDTSNEVILKDLKQRQNLFKVKQFNLIEMRLNGELSTNDFKTTKERLTIELQTLEKEINTRTEYENIKNTEAKRYLDVVHNGVERFKKADDFTKKAIIEAFASNLTILDKSLYFSTKKPLLAVSGIVDNKASKKSASNL